MSILNEQKYLNLLRKVLTEGKERQDRTGVGTYSLFGEQLKLDLREGFPLLTTKKIHFKSVVHELLWMISGSTDASDLESVGVTIWREWADENGDLGPVYGHQWRHWGGLHGSRVAPGFDQLVAVVESIKSDPSSRRHIVTAWNPSDLPDQRLPPCHILFQFYVHDGELSCHLYQRSADIFLGVPFNIASYALLMKMVAHVTNLLPAELIISYGDLHLYKNHVEQAMTQLRRKPNSDAPASVFINEERQSLFDFVYDDIRLVSYYPQSAIPAPVAV